MVAGPDLRTHPGLIAQLEQARQLGFLGPGPVERHIEHASGFLAALVSVRGTVVDLGSGGGVPGLILGVARPDLRLVFVEASARRCRFLEVASEALATPAIVTEARAEEVGRGDLRGAVDAVVARSFGAPAVTAECAAPLLRVGGLLVASEPPSPDPDRWPAAQLARLGMVTHGPPTSSPVIQVLCQRSVCPAEFPRRTGVPAKRPLF